MRKIDPEKPLHIVMAKRCGTTWHQPVLVCVEMRTAKRTKDGLLEGRAFDDAYVVTLARPCDIGAVQGLREGLATLQVKKMQTLQRTYGG